MINIEKKIPVRNALKSQQNGKCKYKERYEGYSPVSVTRLGRRRSAMSFVRNREL
jgi:hypothetical protein